MITKCNHSEADNIKGRNKRFICEKCGYTCIKGKYPAPKKNGCTGQLAYRRDKDGWKDVN